MAAHHLAEIVRFSKMVSMVLTDHEKAAYSSVPHQNIDRLLETAVTIAA
jgi:hypothetical protein